MTKPAIIITDASTGMGGALAEALSGPQWVLALLGHDRVGLERVAEACRAKGAECIVGALDPLDREGVSQFVADLSRHHPIDLLVTNADGSTRRPANQAIESQEEASLVLRANLLSTVELVHMVLPDMVRRRQGRVLILAGMAGFVPLPPAPAYSASQAGLVLFALALGDAVASRGIRVVVCVVPTAKKATLPGRGGALSPAIAVSRILKGLERNRSLIGFPVSLLWLGRAYLLMPQFLRRRMIKLFTNYTSWGC
jgi:short-subunit dehydrogenase